MLKVTHLIPYDGIGGVETAARSMAKASSADIDFRVEMIFSSKKAKSRWRSLNPISFFCSVFHLRRAAPDLLIVSLWRSCVIGLILKLLVPRLQLIIFLHYPKDAHMLDWCFTRLAVHLSRRVWADSRETLTKRLPKLPLEKGRVISFVTTRIPSLPTKSVKPIFAFWGRIHHQKGLARALMILSRVHQRRPDAVFFVIGPDGGDLSRLQKLKDKLSLGASVQFLGAMDFNGIKTWASQASFYLQTSELEGMGMSVVEAMQLGLVPVVTPVGEIAHYACPEDNAVIVTDNEVAVADILALLDDQTRYESMRTRAIATWVEQPLYNDSVLVACREAMD